MRSTWKRALATVLAVVMMAGLLVVPASAALAEGDANKGIYVLDTSTLTGLADGSYVDAGTGNYFAVNGGATSSKKGTFGTEEDEYYANITSNVNMWDTKGATGVSSSKFRRAIKFTTKNAYAEVKMWWLNTNAAGRNPVIYGSESVDDVVWTSALGKDHNGAQYETYIVPAASTTLYIGADSAICFYRVEVVDRAPGDDEILLNFTVPDGITVTDLTVADKAVTVKPAIIVAKNAAVSFKLTAAAGYTVGDVTVGDDTLSADGDGVYTIANVGDAEATVTITASANLNKAASITMDETPITLAPAGTQSLTVTMTAEDPDKDCTDTLEVTTDNENVATWANGTVTAGKIGQATITATAGELTKAVKVSVVGADQEGPVYTFDAANMAVGNLPNGTVKYDNYFTVHANGTAVGNNKVTIDGTEYPNRISGTNTTITFTTKAKSTVTVWFVQNSNRDLKLDDTTASSVLGDGMPSANNSAKVVFENVEVKDGGHTIAMVGGGTEYIYKIVVDETAGEDEVNKTALTAAIAAAKALDTTLATSTDGSDIDQDAKWVTEKMKSDLTTALTAAEALVDAADATQEQVDAAASALDTAVKAYVPANGTKLKTMTVSAENVTATYNGEAKTITVTGAPTGATIEYSTAADGTFSTTPITVTNVADSKTVYYKVTATGYETATGSATITINKATPTITVRADLTDDIPYAQTDVTFTATGVPKDSETVLTGHCTQAEADVNITFAWNTEKTVYSGVSHVAENTTAAAKTHDVAFTWAGDDNYNAATIANVTLTQVAQGAVGTTKATGLAVANGFASKGVTATAADSVTITVDEAAILAAFAADKAAFNASGVLHGTDAYIMVTFDAPEGFDKATWTVQQTVTKDGVKGTPGAKWKLDGTDASNELDVVGTKIGDWFGILKGVNGDTPTMPDAGEYRMEYKFFDGNDNHVATVYYMVDRAVTAAPVEYTVTVNAGANGTASASVAKATAGTEVTLTFTPDSGYVVDSILAVDADSHTVTIGNGGKFTMPASNVTISVTFKANGGEEPPVTEDGYILDANDLEVTDNTVQLGGTKWGTDGFFEVCSTDAGKPFTPATAASFDGKTWDKTITMGGKFAYNSGNPKAALKFTVTKDSTVKVWWANAKDTEARNLAIYDSTGGLVVAATASAEGSYAVENVFEHDLSAGTYYLGSNNSSINIYRVEVKDKAAGGETVDKAALTAAVEAAEAAIDAIAVDTDAANVAEGTKWILAADKATYQTAIDAAKAVATKADATQAEVDAAVTALATATTAFETAQKDGTKTEAPTVDKTALKADIAAAEKLAADTAITAQEDNLAGEKYWDSDMKTAYEAAIADAKAVADKADATADEVADAKAALATATATFKAGKTDGTKVLTEDEVKEALAAAIDAATAAKEGVVANDATDPSDVASGTKYVPTAVMDALEDALKDAEDLKALLDDEDAENDPAAEALTAALVALKNATTDFQPETGTKSSSSSGGGKPAIGSGTKPNGETTKTETLGDGTTVSTTTDAEGNTTVVTKRPDGLETTTVTNKDGDMVITTVNADDVTLAEVKVPGTIPANDQKFVDVPEGHWAEASINNMAALNMVKGVDDVNHIFDMNSDVTRGSVATILYRFANGKAGMSQDFSDVAEGQWYTDAVAWASNAGVVTGFENGTFQPDGSITREQLAVMIYRYAKLIGLDVSAKGDLRIFTDSDAIQSWAVDGMSWCVKNGIINGRGDGTVDPVTAATRAEAAAMLDRFVALLK